MIFYRSILGLPQLLLISFLLLTGLFVASSPKVAFGEGLDDDWAKYVGA